MINYHYPLKVNKIKSKLTNLLRNMGKIKFVHIFTSEEIQCAIIFRKSYKMV